MEQGYFFYFVVLDQHKKKIICIDRFRVLGFFFGFLDKNLFATLLMLKTTLAGQWI